MLEVMRQHLIFIIGTRAQLIKVAPVVVACEKRGMQITLLMTGQHQETMQDLIEEFSIKSPQVEALPATERLTIASLLRWLPQAYKGLEKQLKKLARDDVRQYVLVHGDTLSVRGFRWATIRRENCPFGKRPDVGAVVRPVSGGVVPKTRISNDRRCYVS
jgi:UDP-N-acetylglucosamine 2-epimerase